MENIEKELDDIFNHTNYKDLPNTDSEKTIGVQNDLNELFSKNNVIYTQDSIVDTEYIKISDWQTYKIITYKNGYHELYRETHYGYTDKKIERVKYNIDFINRLRELKSNNNNWDTWQIDENYLGNVYDNEYLDYEHLEHENLYYYDKTSHNNINTRYYEQLRTGIYKNIKNKDIIFK